MRGPGKNRESNMIDINNEIEALLRRAIQAKATGLLENPDAMRACGADRDPWLAKMIATLAREPVIILDVGVPDIIHIPTCIDDLTIAMGIDEGLVDPLVIEDAAERAYDILLDWSTPEAYPAKSPFRCPDCRITGKTAEIREIEGSNGTAIAAIVSCPRCQKEWIVRYMAVEIQDPTVIEPEIMTAPSAQKAEFVD